MTELSTELQAELVEFVRGYAGEHDLPPGRPSWLRWSRELAAKLPKPVDPDIEEASEQRAKIFDACERVSMAVFYHNSAAHLRTKLKSALLDLVGELERSGK